MNTLKSTQSEKFVVVSQSETFPPTLYCDGVNGVSVSAANCRLDLFVVVGSDDAGEKRKLVQTLIIPTAALAEMCRQVLSGFVGGREMLTKALAQHEQKIFNDQIEAVEIKK